MLYENCFNGLTIQPTLSSRKYIFIKHANRSDSYRVFASYDTVSSKTDTFRKDYGDLLGIDLNGQDWQWHHVVERTHLNRLVGENVASHLYQRQVPAVLLHQKTEHVDYNLLHAHGVKTVFDLFEKNKMPHGDEKSNYLTSLRRLYTRVYAHDNVLKTVAVNILGQF